VVSSTTLFYYPSINPIVNPIADTLTVNETPKLVIVRDAAIT
jgi:hypothetical protein